MTLATVAELAHLQAPIIERVTERITLAESIARRALVEGLAECARLRKLGREVATLRRKLVDAQHDAARAERKRIVAILKERAAGYEAVADAEISDDNYHDYQIANAAEVALVVAANAIESVGE